MRIPAMGINLRWSVTWPTRRPRSRGRSGRQQHPLDPRRQLIAVRESTVARGELRVREQPLIGEHPAEALPLALVDHDHVHVAVAGAEGLGRGDLAVAVAFPTGPHAALEV